MNKITGLLGPYGGYVRAMLALRVGKLRGHMSQKDVGASAIELAIITAIVGGVALGLALLIKTVVGNNETQINTLNP